MRPASTSRASCASVSAHSAPRGGFGAGMRVVRWMTTGRSMICTAERPESAARCCSHARCRHVSEHHFGVLPRAFTGIVVPHHGQVMESGRCRRSRTPAPVELTCGSCEAPNPLVGHGSFPIGEVFVTTNIRSRHA